MTPDESLSTRVWQAIAQVFVAHATMLRDIQIIDEASLSALLGAIENVADASPSSIVLHDLITEFDERVDALTPPEIRSALQVGRGTADVQATAARILWRKELADLATATNDVRQSVIDFAGQHVVSLITAYTGGQPAQPTTIGHLLGGVVGPLDRAFARLRNAYDFANESPMGAASLASTGLEIDPARSAELLGFARPCANSFDAVTAVDPFVAALDAAGAIAMPLRRLLDELLQWLRAEPSALQFGEDRPKSDPAMPQLETHDKLTALVRNLSAVERDAVRHRQSLAAVPYGPVFGTDTDELLQATNVIRSARFAVDRTTALFAVEMQINRAVLANRAGKGMTTSSDFADFLMIEEQLSPAAARAIANRTIAMAREEGREASGITPELIDSAALLIIGRELRVEFETISRYLAPRRFIERRALPGGPAPMAMRAYLGEMQARLDEDRRWLVDAVEMNSRAGKLIETGSQSSSF